MLGWLYRKKEGGASMRFLPANAQRPDDETHEVFPVALAVNDHTTDALTYRAGGIPTSTTVLDAGGEVMTVVDETLRGWEILEGDKVVGIMFDEAIARTVTGR